MAELKHQYDEQKDIPEQYRDLYSEKSGKWECTGISGLQTQANVDRLETAIKKEKAETKEAKGKLVAWNELGELEEVQKTMDRVPELELAAKGKLDEAQIEEVVNKRVEATIKTRISPVERENKKLTKERDDLLTENTGFKKEDTKRTIHDSIRKAATGTKLLTEAVDDALTLGERVFEVTEEGAVVTKEGVGVTPGIEPKDWFDEVQEKKPHWWPGTTGGRAPGSGPRGGVTTGVDNPWSGEGWNMTKQGQYLKEHGREKAEAAAKAVGTTIGGRRPALAKK